MNTVDLVVEGYVEVIENGWKASSTTVLITAEPVVIARSETPKQSDSKNPHPHLLPEGEGDQGKKIKILVDPGANRGLLLEHLKKMNVQILDIEYIFLTHFHLDHSLLMGIFPKAKIITFEAITDGEKGELVPSLIPNTDISIIKTPGHEYAGASLLVPTDKGTVGIVGDVFWFEDGEDQTVDIEKKDDFAADMDVLIKSRKEVLQLCDWIIPGHGKMFQVKK